MEYEFKNLNHIADYLMELARRERELYAKGTTHQKAKLALCQAATYESIAFMLRQTRLTEQTITYRAQR